MVVTSRSDKAARWRDDMAEESSELGGATSKKSPTPKSHVSFFWKACAAMAVSGGEGQRSVAGEGWQEQVAAASGEEKWSATRWDAKDVATGGWNSSRRLDSLGRQQVGGRLGWWSATRDRGGGTEGKGGTPRTSMEGYYKPAAGEDARKTENSAVQNPERAEFCGAEFWAWLLGGEDYGGGCEVVALVRESQQEGERKRWSGSGGSLAVQQLL